MTKLLSVFSAPGRYVQGPDATSQLGDELRYLGFTGPVLIVASASANKILAEIACHRYLDRAKFA